MVTAKVQTWEYIHTLTARWSLPKCKHESIFIHWLHDGHCQSANMRVYSYIDGTMVTVKVQTWEYIHTLTARWSLSKCKHESIFIHWRHDGHCQSANMRVYSYINGTMVTVKVQTWEYIHTLTARCPLPKCKHESIFIHWRHDGHCQSANMRVYSYIDGTMVTVKVQTWEYIHTLTARWSLPKCKHESIFIH